MTSKQGSFLVRCLAWHACSLRFLFQKAGRENARRPQRHRLATMWLALAGRGGPACAAQQAVAVTTIGWAYVFFERRPAYASAHARGQGERDRSR